MRSAYHQYFYFNNELKKSSEYNSDLLQFGTSIYEVIRIINKKSLFFEEHYTRLVKSAHLLNIDLWISKKEIKDQMKELTNVNTILNGNIELIFNHTDKNKIFLCLFIEDRYPTDDMYWTGISSELYYAERDKPSVKSINLKLREQTVNEIQLKDVYEVLLVNKDDYITEGSRSNIFLIKENKIFTTPLKDVLAGITRSKIIEVSQALNYTIIENEIHIKELANFEAAFYTGTSPKAIPIANIGKIKYNPSHPILQSIIKGYDNLIEEHLINTK